MLGWEVAGYMLRGQTELISAMILIGAVLVVGIAFSSLATSYVSSIVGRGRVEQVLMSEQANLVLYKEFENGTTLCLGVLRITPSTTRYAVTLFSMDMKINSTGAIRIPVTTTTLSKRSVPASSVHYVYMGDYYPVSGKGYVSVVEVPQDVIKNYVMQQKPFLVCIDKSSIPSQGAKIMFFIYIGSDLYEVGEWSAYPS